MGITHIIVVRNSIYFWHILNFIRGTHIVPDKIYLTVLSRLTTEVCWYGNKFCFVDNKPKPIHVNYVHEYLKENLADRDGSSNLHAVCFEDFVYVIVNSSFLFCSWEFKLQEIFN